MKKFRKLIPALFMLLVSALFVGTSTYAWFSMNTQVTANNMQVKAKSNATYLLIGDDSAKAADSAKTDAAGTDLTNSHAAKLTTTDNTELKCYPTAYYAAEGTLNGHTTAAGKWYTTSSDKHDTAVSGSAAIKEVTEGDKDYMLTYKMYLTLTNDSENYTGKLKVTPAFTNNDAAVKAMVVIGTEKHIVDSTNTAFTTTGDVTLTATTAVEVTVYVYVDGNSTNVNSNFINAAETKDKLAGDLSVQFDLVPATV